MNFKLKLHCINPLSKSNHGGTNELFDFPPSLRSKYPLIPDGAKICSRCRRELYRQKDTLEQDSNNESAPDAKKAKLECNNEYHKAGVTVLEQIKSKFSESTKREERIQLLTLAPKFWSRRNLINEFGCTEWEA